MPYINLLVYPGISNEQAAVLADGITDAMVEVMGKRRGVTAVRVAEANAAVWTLGGALTAAPTAYLDVKITAGTNSTAEKEELLRRLHGLLKATLGELAEASYIVIHELPAENWGYSGITQAARAGSRL